MPWFPEFTSAVELVRQQTRAAGRADPVAQYLASLDGRDAHDLELAWPGHVVVYDPYRGEVRGHRQLARFVRESGAWLAGRHARVETETSMCVDRRAVVELTAHLAGGAAELAWPVAVVAESPDDASVVFRTYCSQLPVDGRPHVRAPVLAPGDARPGDVVGRYHAAMAAGDADAVLACFAPDGYLRGSTGDVHRGGGELRPYVGGRLASGGIDLRPCAVTDDGVRCAVEYTCLRWGTRELAPQAGLAVFERTPDGLLAAVRCYDDLDDGATTAAR
jgi:hypothetical protein